MTKIRTQEDNDCWIWTGAKTKTGYGHFFFNGKTIGAHVYSWLQSRGEKEVPEGFEVAHRCHNSSCVRPIHLELLIHIENCRILKPRPFVYAPSTPNVTVVKSLGIGEKGLDTRSPVPQDRDIKGGGNEAQPNRKEPR